MFAYMIVGVCGLSLRETENSNSSSKTLFYKDCSLGSVKTRLIISPCEATDE